MNDVWCVKPVEAKKRSLCLLVHNILHVDFAGFESQPLRWQVWKEAEGPF